MVIVLAALMAAAAFAILIRLLWLSKRPSVPTTVITIASVALVAGLGVLAASGRLHWLAAIGAALLPFMKRGLSLIRYLPLLRGLFGSYQSARGTHSGERHHQSGDDMTREKACDVLGLQSDPSREEIIAAHRRLMQKIHPDRGGSTWMAQQLNEAKRVLLKSAP